MSETGGVISGALELIGVSVERWRQVAEQMESERDALAVENGELRTALTRLYYGASGADYLRPRWNFIYNILSRPASTRGAELLAAAHAMAEAGRIAAGALMLVHSADSLREKDRIAMAALQAFVTVSGITSGSLTPDEARRVLAGDAGERG